MVRRIFTDTPLALSPDEVEVVKDALAQYVGYCKKASTGASHSGTNWKRTRRVTARLLVRMLDDE